MMRNRTKYDTTKFRVRIFLGKTLINFNLMNNPKEKTFLYRTIVSNFFS